MKIAIIQARVASERLPRKVLKELPFGSGIPVLGQIVRRLKHSKYIEGIVIATTMRPDDDPIIELAEQEGVMYHRGGTADVLGRYYSAASEHGAGTIVRICGDCPCVDPFIVDDLIYRHCSGCVDYTSNFLRTDLPRGLQAEVFSMTALERAHKEAKSEFEREHVTPFIYNNPGIFKIAPLKSACTHDSDIRVVLDTEEDYAALSAVFDFLWRKNTVFSKEDIVELYGQKPWLKLINRKVSQEKYYTDISAEIDEAIRVLAIQGLKKARIILERHRDNMVTESR